MSENAYAKRLITLLRQKGDTLVLAESCTGGLAAALITQFAGVSDCFCGSAVTYLDQVKVDWLGVDKMSIDAYSAVSASVACEMSTGALQKTAGASVAAAVTGHLGPNAPRERDGIVFVSFVRRNSPSSGHHSESFRLSSPDRTSRQQEAANLFLNFVSKNLIL